MKDEEIKLPSVFKSFGNNRIDSSVMKSIDHYARETVRLNLNYSASMESRSDAWLRVAKTLDKLCPYWWQAEGKTGMDAAINAITKAFESNSINSEPLPFNLEAAKRGDPIVTRDGRDVEFIIHVKDCHQVIAVIGVNKSISIFDENGSWSEIRVDVSDNDLFMKPKLRTVWVTQKSDGTLTVSDNEIKQMVDAFNSECETYTSSVLIPDLR